MKTQASSTLVGKEIPRFAFSLTALATVFVFAEGIHWIVTQSSFAVRFSAADLLFHFGPCAMLALCAVLLRFRPKHNKLIGLGVGFFALLSIVSGGGFLAGLAIGILGAVLSLFWKSQTFLVRPIQDCLSKLTQKNRVAVLAAVVVVAVLVVIPTEVSYQIAMNTTRTAPAFESKLIDTPNGLIEYADIGEGYPVLVSHGAGMGYLQIQSVQQMIGTDNLRLIVPSRFGYIRTPMPSDGSFDAQADLFKELLDALNISKVVIMGVSIGGPTALAFATRYPERCSALIMAAAISHNTPTFDTIGLITHQVVFRSDFGFWMLSTSLQSELVTFLGVTKQVQANLTTVDKQYISDMLLSMQPISLRQSGLVNDPTHSAYELENYHLETITMPTLVFHANDDGLVPFDHGQYTAQHIPGAKFVKFESGGHLLVGQLNCIHSETQNFLKQNQIIQ